MSATTTTAPRYPPSTLLRGRTDEWRLAAPRSRMPLPTWSRPGAAVELQLQPQLLHQPRLLLAHQGGRRAPTCQVSVFAWLEFISPLTGSFMLWAGAVLMQQ